MDVKRLIVLIIAAILVLSLIFGVVFSLYRLIRSRQNTIPTTSGPKPQVTISPLPSALPQTPPTTGTTPWQTVTGNFKTYTGQGFLLSYPKNWGLLTCRNSQNFEFDPANPTDQLNVNCDRAVKPITVQSSFLTGCAGGQQITLGNNSVVKVVSGSDYKWCVGGGAVPLEVTHRVSGTDNRSAFSKTDYSSQVEQMISTLRFGGGS